MKINTVGNLNHEDISLSDLNSESDDEELAGQTILPNSDSDASLDNNVSSDPEEGEEESVDSYTAADLVV